jgi:hypothetical protein
VVPFRGGAPRPGANPLWLGLCSARGIDHHREEGEAMTEATDVLAKAASELRRLKSDELADLCILLTMLADLDQMAVARGRLLEVVASRSLKFKKVGPFDAASFLRRSRRCRPEIRRVAGTPRLPQGS